MEAQGNMGFSAENFDPVLLEKLRDNENESPSGDDKVEGALVEGPLVEGALVEGASGDDQQERGDDSGRPIKYYRLSNSQTQELESIFKECPHPDEKQRLELGRKLGMESKQVKFWFQNRRTQMKTQLERHENILLKQEYDKLWAENILMKEAIDNLNCNTCGGPALVGSISREDHLLKIDNARMREELNRVCALASNFTGNNASSFVNPLEIPNTSNDMEPVAADFDGVGTSALPTGLGIDNGSGSVSSPLSSMKPPLAMMGNDEKSVLLNIAFNAMDELMRLAQAAPPLWLKTLDGEKEVLNREEYFSSFNSCFDLTPAGYVTEATRDSGMVISSSAALVEIFNDANRWKELFKDMIAAAATVDIVSDASSSSKNGAVQLMHAEMQVLSPLVPIRRSRILRFSKQYAEGLWAVVDISIDNGNPFPNCKRLPSGIVVQDMPNGYCKVICVEHSEYDESGIHQLYKPLVSSGMAFGAKRCIATLQRQCESFKLLTNPPMPSDDDPDDISQAGKESVWKLAQRMTNSFFSGICATGPYYWEKFPMGNLGDMRMMTRQNLTDPGEPIGVLLSAATSVWMPVSHRTLFNFLRNKQLRGTWDLLVQDAPMEDVIDIAKSQADGNSISILNCTAEDGNDDSTLILQETWTDASSSLLVYAPVDMQSLNAVLNGEESSCLALLPSGFAIHPDDQSVYSNAGYDAGGCLLTIGIQTLIDENPSSKLSDKTAQTVNSIMTSLIQRINAALQV